MAQFNRTAMRALATMIALAFTTAILSRGPILMAAETKIPVTFSGGHDIGANDFGRPVTLMAAALKVKPDVFRQAFGDVTPARGRGPTGAEARRNKEALMSVLGPLGVLNERMDEVADYYRFRPQNGELWPTRTAKAHAVVKEGQVDRIVVTDPGAGYSSLPRITVKGFPRTKFEVKLRYSADLEKNGGVGSIKIAPAKKPTTKR